MFEIILQKIYQFRLELNEDFAPGTNLSGWIVGITEDPDTKRKSLTEPQLWNAVNCDENVMAKFLLDGLIKDGAIKDDENSSGQFVYCYQ